MLDEAHQIYAIAEDLAVTVVVQSVDAKWERIMKNRKTELNSVE